MQHQKRGPFVQLRYVCKCNSRTGVVFLKGQQNVIRCMDCNAYAFCCPHADLMAIRVSEPLAKFQRGLCAPKHKASK